MSPASSTCSLVVHTSSLPKVLKILVGSHASGIHTEICNGGSAANPFGILLNCNSDAFVRFVRSFQHLEV